MMNNNITTESHWDGIYSQKSFRRLSENDSFNAFICKYVPTTNKGCCIEIGSYPGTLLATIGDLGYELNGVDYNPNNNTSLPSWLKTQGFNAGEFWVADFFSFKTERKFDLVASFGFIEHFIDYEEVIRKHAALVNTGGLIVITAPNFRGGLQHFLHAWLDKDNLRMHHLPSMVPKQWARLLRQQGFEIMFEGYFGGLGFWCEPGQRRSRFQELGLRFVTYLFPKLRKIYLFNSSFFSCHCGVVARRTAVIDSNGL